MTPSLSIPTDNIYKFSCLFGLALIIVSIFSYITIYSSYLEKKIRYFEVIIPLEYNTQRNKADNDLLELNKKLIEVSISNEKTAKKIIGSVLGFGIFFSALGAYKWHEKIQKRDDKLAQLQIDKLEAEVTKLRIEVAASMQSLPTNAVESESIAHE
ncbi:MAG: hypothetical protein ACXWFG_13650 [Methylobacter sp.]